MSDAYEPTPDEAKLVSAAEAAIVAILAKLEDATGRSIDFVEVDTRNWGRLGTTILLTRRARQ